MRQNSLIWIKSLAKAQIAKCRFLFGDRGPDPRPGGDVVAAVRLSGESGDPGTAASWPRGARVSLRTKGVVAFAILALYVAVIAALIVLQHVSMGTTVDQQRSLYATEERLGRLNTALAYAILNVNEAEVATNSRVSADSVALDIGAVQAGLQGLLESHPAVHPWILRLDRSSAMIKANWGSRSLDELRADLHQLVTQLDEVTSQVRSQQSGLTEKFRRTYNAFTATLTIAGLAGILLFGSVVVWFFSRLVWDIRRLQARATEVVTGYRGVPIQVTRHDELGALMESVNNMQSELRNREKHIEIARQQRFHHEKMAVIGSLAAIIAHEVNNPIAAITGVAEAIEEKKRHCQHFREFDCRPELILEQTRRISDITRQLAELSASYPPERQLLDLNELVRKTGSFIRFDKRFGNIELNLDLGSQLPAVVAVADHLTQILMNLLLNAADAVGAVAGRSPTIAVETRATAGEVALAVVDNGCGMSPEILARAFDEWFSTKPAGLGRGIGLFVCRSLIESAGGRIELDSVSGQGTRATVFLPRSSAN